MISNVCVIGNDGRMNYIAQDFYDIGFEVYRNYDAVDKDSVIILPTPAGEVIERKIIPILKKGQRIYGGMISNELKEKCTGLGIDVYDYMEWQEVKERNAVLTANGILSEAACMGAVINRSFCLVTGFGHCGRNIAARLFDSGAYVDVMVRRREQKGQIKAAGYDFIDLNNPDRSKFFKYSYIFNTVPALIFDRELISKLTGNVMIFDVASAPGGVDFEYCSKNGFFAIQSLGIPGRRYPKQAGSIISRAIISDLTRKGLLT